MGKNGLTRRQLLQAGAAAGAASLAPRGFADVWIPSKFEPIVLGSSNGFMFKNDGPRTVVEEAFMRITRGEDVLEAVVAGVNIEELDPKDDSVGYGGIPNAHGVVQLDACVMHGTLKRAGGVAALEGVRTPSVVAKMVADRTDHHLLVGKGAQDFARSMGMKIEDDLNTEHSRRVWLEWKRRTDKEHYPSEKDREIGSLQVALQMADEGWLNRQHVYGTINCCAMNEKGDLAGVTTTSGLAFKIPGRVGDSPILGAGLYVDGDVGTAGSTGRGEANLYGLCCYLIVEEMRRGAHPKDAGMTALKRVRDNTIEKRLKDETGPNFGLEFYALDRQGRHAGVTLRGSGRYAVCDANGPRFVPCEALIP